MPTVLSCTDGSLYAASVYDHTSWAAQRLQADITILHMVEPKVYPVMADAGALGFDAQSELTAQLVSVAQSEREHVQTQGRAILKEAQRHFQAGGFPEINTEIAHGALVDEIERRQTGANLVVIGKRGEHADFAKLHLGSNLERVIRTCDRPVLVASRSFQPIQRIMIAFDGGPSAMKAVHYAASEPLLKGLACHLISVSSGGSTLSKELQVAGEQLTAAGYSVSAEEKTGEAEAVITDAVTSLGIDLLVMGAYGHSRIRQLFVGSTTTQMIRTVTIPVLLFR
jgi:nucleotide-binding universal stress UspA family protein